MTTKSAVKKGKGDHPPYGLRPILYPCRRRTNVKDRKYRKHSGRSEAIYGRMRRPDLVSLGRVRDVLVSLVSSLE